MLLISWPDYDCKKAKANLIECIFHCECILAKSLTYYSLGFFCLVILTWFRTQSAQQNILRGCSRCLACIPLSATWQQGLRASKSMQPRAAPSHWDCGQRSQGSTESRVHSLALHRSSLLDSHLIYGPAALQCCPAMVPWAGLLHWPTRGARHCPVPSLG